MNRRSFIRTLTASGVSLFLPKIIETVRWKRPRPFVKFLGVSDYVEVVPDTLHFNSDPREEDVSFLLSHLFAANPLSNHRPAMMMCSEEEYRAIKAYTKGLPV